MQHLLFYHPNMPPNRKKDTPEEARIAKAIEAIHSKECVSIAAAHRQFNVLYQKLCNRLNSTAPDSSNSGRNKVLDKVQEAVLLYYIDRCYKLGRPANRCMITLAANSILRTSGNTRIVSKP
jgi:hypothetical protein